MVGIHLIQKTQVSLQAFGSIAFGAAVFFKLWPVFLVLLLLLFQWSRIKILPRLLLLAGLIYWVMRIQEIKGMIKATQSGSPFGVSFGLRLFANAQLSLNQSLILIVFSFVILYLLIRAGNKSLYEFLATKDNSGSLTWILPIMLTYCAIWVTSDSYIYRMVIFIPLILIFSKAETSQQDWPKFVIAVVLVTAISSRLPVTIAISSALALYFLYVALVVMCNGFRLTFRAR